MWYLLVYRLLKLFILVLFLKLWVGDILISRLDVLRVWLGWRVDWICVLGRFVRFNKVCFRFGFCMGLFSGSCFKGVRVEGCRLDWLFMCIWLSLFFSMVMLSMLFLSF